MKCHIVLLLSFPLFAIIPLTVSYNILVILPHPGKSHFLVFQNLLRTLAERGHQITTVSHFQLEDNVPNYKHIDIGGFESFAALESTKLMDLKNIDSKSRLLKYFTSVMLADIGQKACELGLGSNAVRSFLKQKTKFDLALMEYFNSDCFLLVVKTLNVPVVRLHSASLMPWSTYRYGIPNNPSYIPNNFMPFSDEMTFFERTENALLTWLHSFYYNNLIWNSDKSVTNKYLGEYEGLVNDDMFHDSLLLTASHFTLNLPRPLVPSIIEIGGIHLQTAKALPKNLEKWIKESPHGVIYFSFGSLVKGYTMPADKRQAFINAFKRLPQRVIWKWENDTMEGKSDNIMIGKWLPQFDILSHPNVKAFISHGGLLGTFEAVHCGVPILVMPQFGDQHTNAKAIESVGGGEILYLSDATEEKIYNALTKTLSPSFQQQAKELSERFRDRPMPPLETAIYWVEYVARHKGAHFMKTAAVGMPFYQYYLLDVIAFLLAVLILFLYLVYLVLRFFVRLVFKPKQPTKVKKS